jgi:hypothetical protein
MCCQRNSRSAPQTTDVRMVPDRLTPETRFRYAALLITPDGQGGDHARSLRRPSTREEFDAYLFEQKITASAEGEEAAEGDGLPYRHVTIYPARP